MAEFNPREQRDPLPPSYVQGSMRQYEGDRSGAILGEGLTEAFSQFIRATDENIQQRIADDIARDFDTLNREAGLDRLPEANLGDAPMDILPPSVSNQVPPGIQAAQRQAQVIQQGYNQGVISEAYYWDRMNALLRTTRGKYPGYRHQVDQAFRSVTGARGNELRDYLFAQRGKEDPAVARYNRLVDQNRQHLPPDYHKRIREGNPYDYFELEEYITRSIQEDAEVARESARLNRDAARGAVTKENAATMFRASAVRISRRLMTDSLGASGFTIPQLSQMVQEWDELRRRGASLDATRQGEVLSGLNQMRTMAVQLLQNEYVRPRTDNGDSFALYVDDTTRKDVEAAALVPIDNLIRAVRTGDLPLMKATVDWLEATKDLSAQELVQRVPELRVFPSITEWMGEQTSSNIARAIGAEKAIIRSILTRDIGQLHTPGTPEPGRTMPGSTQAPSITRDMDRAARTSGAEEYGNAAIKAWRAIAASINSGEVPREAAARHVQYMFGPDNLEFLRGATMDSRRAYFNQVASPEVTQAMLRLRQAGDETSWQTYRNWTLNVFRTLSDEAFRSLEQYTVDRQRLNLQFDPKTNRFVFATNLGVRNQTETPFSESQMSAEFREAQIAVERVNRLIQNVVPVITAEGGNPADQITRLLLRQRVNVDQPQTILDAMAEGVTEAAGPPDPNSSDLWRDADPFRPQFRAPVGTQGDRQPGEIDVGFAPVLDLIGKAEGTDKARGYDETLAYGAFTGGPVNLTGMTLDEIDQLQTRMLRHPRNSWRSSAVGRYQIVRTTLRELRQEMGLTGNEKFTPELQDRLAIRLLRRRGLDRWVRGEIDDATFMANLSREWASLPQASGRGTYAGQRTGARVAEVMTALASLKEEKAIPVLSARAENLMRRLRSGEEVSDAEFNRLSDRDKARILAEAIGEM